MTKIEIINIALARLGESPIQSIDEGSVAANTAKLLYDSARQSILRDYNWNFALTEKDLVRYQENTSKFYEYAYALPHDCIRAVRLASGSTFTVSGGKLYCNDDKVCLQYISDVTDENMFDSKFVEAFGYKLASELAMPIKGSGELMANYSNAYMNVAKSAATQSAREEHASLSDNPYVDARN